MVMSIVQMSSLKINASSLPQKASLRKAKAQSLYEAVAKHGEHAEAAGEAREVRFAARHACTFFRAPLPQFPSLHKLR